VGSPARTVGPGGRIVRSVAVAALLAGCAAGELPGSVVAVPTQTPGPPLDFGPQGCPAALLEGTLIPDDDFGFVVLHDDEGLPPNVVVWPNGWAALDVDGVRQLLDDGGNVVAREGDRVHAGGGWYPPNEWFYPCGEITFNAES
jgi:hypothetical protein